MSISKELIELINKDCWEKVPDHVFKLIDDNKDDIVKIDEILLTYNEL